MDVSLVRSGKGPINGPGNDEIPGPPDLIEQAFDGSPTPVTGAAQVNLGSPAPGHLLFRLSTCPCENVRMDGLACPCGLGDDYKSCCGRLHAGEADLNQSGELFGRYCPERAAQMRIAAATARIPSAGPAAPTMLIDDLALARRRIHRRPRREGTAL